jgi:hypothetical protein
MKNVQSNCGYEFSLNDLPGANLFGLSEAQRSKHVELGLRKRSSQREQRAQYCLILRGMAGQMTEM